MNRLPSEVQEDIAALTAEGLGIRGISRKLDITQNTVMRNLLWIGEACQKLHDEMVCELKTKRFEADELWSLIGGRSQNLRAELRNHPEFGEMYTWTAIDPDTKLVIGWHVSKRDLKNCQIFAQDLASRIVSDHVQISTDQLVHYRDAFAEAFGNQASYATIRSTKSPPTVTADGKIKKGDKVVGERRAAVFGNPDMSKVSTYVVENLNLQIRMNNARYESDTNAISKKIANKRAALAVYFTYWNFCRRHSVIRCTPAMEAKITDRIWTVEDLVALVPPRPDRWAKVRKLGEASS